MIEAPIPANEPERLAALYTLHILDTPAEERFDRLTRLAIKLFDVPIAYVSIVDANRQWFKSACGIDRGQTDRGISFCGHAILQDEPLIIPDALLDDRFYDNPLVTRDPKLRFYAGCPLQTPSGHKVATLCIGDRCPREFVGEQVDVLKSLAAIAEDQINLLDTVHLQEKLVEAKQQIEHTNHELQNMNEYIKKALGCYATEEAVQNVLSSAGKLELGGQKRPVSILLSDLRGFTAFSEQYSPEVVVEGAQPLPRRDGRHHPQARRDHRLVHRRWNPGHL